MFFKKPLDESLDEDDGVHHKSHTERVYASFFEGYTEVEVLNKHHKKKMVRRYTDPYYTQDIEDKTLIFVKLFYFISFLVFCVATWFLGIFIAELGVRWVELFFAANIFFLGWFLIALVYYIPTKRNMTIYRHSSSTKHTRRSSFCLACVFAAMFVALCIQMIISKSFNVWSPLLAAFCSALAFSVYMLERHIPYKKVANEY